jgi:hypothetical protein
MEKIFGRIQKMLNLANDLAASEGERDNALRMAYNLMAKHNLDMAAVEAHGESKQEKRIDFENQSFSWQWARQINNIIGDLFFCKVWSSKVSTSQNKFHFIGRESNAMTAAVMADWIVKSILKEGRKMYGQNTAPGTRSFAVGAMYALHARVKEIKASQAAASEAATPGTALVLASFYDTEAAANELMLPEGLRYRKARASSVDHDAFNKGQDFGNKINLSNQVTEEARKIK